MKLVVMIPKESSGFWTSPIILVTSRWGQPEPNQYFSGVGETGEKRTASIDDCNVYIWDAQAVFDEIAKALWASLELLRL